MNYHIDLQHANPNPNPVEDELISTWAELALSRCCEAAELTIRFVTLAEMIELNHTYRHQNKPTNVLAFRSDISPEIQLDYPFLGDIVICPEVLLAESQDLNCSLTTHWAHIVLHGVLHLLGYDHIAPQDEAKMQALEIELLAELGYQNPYLIDKGSENALD